MNDDQPSNRIGPLPEAASSSHREDRLFETQPQQRKWRRSRRLLTFAGVALLLLLATIEYVRKQQLAAERLDLAVTRPEKQTFRKHEVSVTAIAFSPDGKVLASGGGDQKILVWDVASGQQTTAFKDLKDNGGAVWSVAFSPDGKTLASAGASPTIKLWNVATGQNSATLGGHEGSIYIVTFSPDGRMLASASDDSTIKLWEVASGQNLATLKGHTGAADSVAFAPGGKMLASASIDGTIKLWEIASRRNVATLEGPWTTKLLGLATGGNHVRSVAFSPDGKTLASGDTLNTVKLWDVTSGQCLATLRGHKRLVRVVAFSPDGKTLASASYDGTIRLWDVASRQLLALFKGHQDSVYALSFSPDGKTFASASGDRTFKLWDVAH
jgi:WD40 repeat protein